MSRKRILKVEIEKEKTKENNIKFNVLITNKKIQRELLGNYNSLEELISELGAELYDFCLKRGIINE